MTIRDAPIVYRHRFWGVREVICWCLSHRLRPLPGHHRTARLAGPVSGVCRRLRRAEAPAVLGLYPPGVRAGGVAEDARGRRGKVRRAGQLFHRHALLFEQSDLLLAAERILSSGAVVLDHPVAGDEERDGVVCHHRAHGAGGLRGAGLAGHPGVGPDLAARNPLYYLQHLLLKGRRPREVCRYLHLLTGERRGNPLGEPVRPFACAPRKEVAEAFFVAPGELPWGGSPPHQAHASLAHPYVDLAQRRIAREEAIGPAREHALYQFVRISSGYQACGSLPEQPIHTLLPSLFT